MGGRGAGWSKSNAQAENLFTIHSDIDLEYSSDTPCASETACKIQERIANKCSYAREVMQLVYEAVNVVAHIIAVVITRLCGCLCAARRILSFHMPLHMELLLAKIHC